MTARLPLAIIQLESPPGAVSARVGEQAQWFVAALELSASDYIVVRPDRGEALPDVHAISAAILSGSWAMVTDRADWSERTAAWVRHAVAEQLPLLGVCYGHQLMSYALGGNVGDNPAGWERGAVRVTGDARMRQDPLLSALPDRFTAWLSHRQSVLTPPVGAQVLARSPQDGCQIIRYSAQALSVQFHPEFTPEIMTACLQNSLSEVEVARLMTAQPVPQWPARLLGDFWQQVQPVAQRA
ncbi:glutamine amidotransferase [Erwinia persicina]|nr:glutamine amidotransferase [Erwinia persicina]MBD8213313.1 glutamine amidotransferase [Erwinia persicina]